MAHEISQNNSLLRGLHPSVYSTGDGIYVELSAGRSTVLPSDLTTDPIVVARLHEDYPESGYWRALAIGGATAAGNALLEGLGIIHTPEPWYIDAGLNFASGYVLGSAFNQGSIHRDLALGGLNALGGWAFQSIFDGPGRPIEDVRYDILSYGAIYALKGLLPSNGNPIFTNGLGPANRIVNFATDVAFAGLWDGAAGVTAQSLRGHPKSWDFTWDISYGLAGKTAQNLLYGTRMEFDPGVYSEAERLARQHAGVDIGPVINDFDLRRGGFIVSAIDVGGFAHPNWISINNNSALAFDPDIWDSRQSYYGDLGAFLGHEYTHAWSMDRMGAQFALFYAWRAVILGEGNGAANQYEDLANMVDRPTKTQEQIADEMQSSP